MNVSRETLTTEHFFELSHLWFASVFQGLESPWEVLQPKFKESWIQKQLKANVQALPRQDSMVLKTTEVKAGSGKALVQAGAFIVGEDVELRQGTIVEAGAWVQGPTILGPETLVRQGAYVRGGVLTGTKAIIGHATEVKSSLFLNGAKAAHFAYVGDSILGNQVNLGAGTKVSNLKMTNDEILLRVAEKSIPTGLRKMGALIGDRTETGCNSVLNPGVLLGKGCMVYPAIAVRKAYYPPKTWIKK